MENEDDFGIVGAMLAGAFFVERVVAHGGFAIVYRGFHSGFRAPIALKCLRIPEGMTSTQRTTFLERFREEGEFLFRLSAAIPEVVRPLHIDAVQLPSGVLMPFLALEWLEGEGFDQVIDRVRGERNQGLDFPTLVEMLRPVANALQRAHNFPTDRGSVAVVHRDLKPENLFLCNVAGASAIKILDYGIAEVCSVAQQMSGARAWAGMNPFTPGYGAPEQWSPERFGVCGPWTDVWGLAITMVEALLGRPPIDGEVEDMRRIALDPRQRPTPRALGCALSNEAEAAFARALALQPRDRTQDIATFWAEMEAAAGEGRESSRNAAPVSRRAGLRRPAEKDLSEIPAESSIDLDLAVAPESLRAPPRSTPSVPPARGSMASVSGSYQSVPPSSRRVGSLDLRDELPMSQRPPISGPRSTRGPLSEIPPSSIRPRPPESAPPAPPGRPALPSDHDSPLKQVASVITGRFKIPSILLGFAIAISLLDLAAVRFSGSPITFGPVRTLWVAGPFAILGALLLIWKIVGEEDDG